MTKKLWVAAGVLALGMTPAGLAAAEEAMAARVGALVPKLEAYVEGGMKAFDDPGLAIGIVVADKLVYAKGFGVGKKGGAPVDPDTIFQIGSTTKGFLATTMAIAVDRKLFKWDDRVVDLYPGFQLKDPWVTHEFRMFDLLAQRSGLPPYANDFIGFVGFDQEAMIHSLRYVDPVSSFRSTFAYTNITHMVAERIVAKAFGEPDWPSVVEKTITGPLGMKRTSFTADAIEAAENTTIGHRYTPNGSIEVPFTPIFPYEFGGAGAINSSVNDLAPWVMLHLDRGSTPGGDKIVSPENLAVTKTARVGLNEGWSYGMGWVLESTPNGTITWHNGGTSAYGAYIGTALDQGVGVIVLTNLVNVGFPDAIGQWTFDQLLGNPEVDDVALKLASAKAAFAKAEPAAAPADPAASPPLSTLAGTYESGKFGTVTVAASGEVLEMALSTGAKLRMAHWDGDTFSTSLVPEGRFQAIAADLGPNPLGLAQFRVDGDGQWNGITLTMAEDGQTVEFVRQLPPAP
jgi:CubicO group peptidase (beta-lactamase class C family)